MRFLKLFLLIGFFTLLGCTEEKPEFPKFVFEFNGAVNDLKQGDILPNSIKSIINYYENNDEDSECYGKLFAPDVIFHRIDIDKEEILGTPLSATGKLQKRFGTLSKVNLKSMYDVDRFKIPKLLVKEGKKHNPIKNKKNIIMLNINSSKKQVSDIRKEVERKLCEGATKIIIRVKDENVLPPPDTITPPPPPTGPCQTNTIPAGLELKDKLVEIIDTKRSTTERIKLAEQVWNKYFDNDAYVAKYLHVGDKNSEIWDPGEGKEYFTSRLAILKSIYDINIIRLEYSKEDPNKISGIHIVECHNASQKI